MPFITHALPFELPPQHHPCHLTSSPQLDLWPRGPHVKYIGHWLWGQKSSTASGASKAIDPPETIHWPPSNTSNPSNPSNLSPEPNAKVFVYLPADLPQLHSVRDQLLNLGWPTLAVIRDASPSELQAWAADHIHAQSEHVDMAQALTQAQTQATVRITHAGHSTVCQALLAGVPMVLIPRSLETRHTAIAAANAKAAVIADMPEADDSTIHDLAGSIGRAIALRSVGEPKMPGTGAEPIPTAPPPDSAKSTSGSPTNQQHKE